MPEEQKNTINKTKKTNEQNKSNRLSDEDKAILRNAEILRMIPDNIAAALAKARTKPVWCTDMRWRMELGRRKHRYAW